MVCFNFHTYPFFQILRVPLRHLVLPILKAAPPPFSSTTYPHGGLPPRHLVFTFIPRQVFLRHSLFTSAFLPPRHVAFHFQSRLVFLTHSLLAIWVPPRHLTFHFPTTSGLPHALSLNHLATYAPSCFSLSNLVRSSSGTPSFEVHEQVVPSP